MLTESQRLTAKRVADRYVGRDGGEPDGRPTNAGAKRLTMNVNLDMVEAGLGDRAPIGKRRQAAAAFKRLRAILAEDYQLDCEPPRSR